MKKVIPVIAACLLLSACSAQVPENTQQPVEQVSDTQAKSNENKQQTEPIKLSNFVKSPENAKQLLDKAYKSKQISAYQVSKNNEDYSVALAQFKVDTDHKLSKGEALELLGTFGFSDFASKVEFSSSSNYEFTDKSVADFKNETDAFWEAAGKVTNYKLEILDKYLIFTVYNAAEVPAFPFDLSTGKQTDIAPSDMFYVQL